MPPPFPRLEPGAASFYTYRRTILSQGTAATRPVPTAPAFPVSKEIKHTGWKH